MVEWTLSHTWEEATTILLDWKNISWLIFTCQIFEVLYYGKWVKKVAKQICGNCLELIILKLKMAKLSHQRSIMLQNWSWLISHVWPSKFFIVRLSQKRKNKHIFLNNYQELNQTFLTPFQDLWTLKFIVLKRETPKFLNFDFEYWTCGAIFNISSALFIIYQGAKIWLGGKCICLFLRDKLRSQLLFIASRGGHLKICPGTSVPTKTLWRAWWGTWQEQLGRWQLTLGCNCQLPFSLGSRGTERKIRPK